MSRGSSLPYRLRPNKAVDRELFLSFLGRIAATLKLETYQYIGLGGPFMEDFRLIHARLGITNMICIEAEEEVHKRQSFNKPVQSIECVHNTLEDYLDEADLENPCIIWMDYTDPQSRSDQIERFARTVGSVALRSILRVTLNANPASLGNPHRDEITAKVGNLPAAKAGKPTLQEWRLERFRKHMGGLCPSDLSADGMTQKAFGKSILRVLKLAVENELLRHRDRDIVWALATHYSDGQAMATATLVVHEQGEKELASLVKDWEFHSTPDAPLVLDMPALSPLERLTMESAEDPKERLGFHLPKSDMGQDPFESFKRFYRIYPHFSRIEL